MFVCLCEDRHEPARDTCDIAKNVNSAAVSPDDVLDCLPDLIIIT